MASARPHAPGRVLAAVVLTASTALALAGCGDEGGADPSAQAPSSSAPASSQPSSQPSSPAPTSSAAASEPAAEVVITISDFAFDVPATVPPGAQVTVVNEDSSFHTVTADDGAFDVDAPGNATVTFTAPDEPGEYPFSCTPHPQMTALLTVG